MSDKNQTPEWMTNPQRAAEAMRDATTQAIDGLIEMQDEMRKAMERNIAALRQENEKIVANANKAFDEAISASFDGSRKVLAWYKEQTQRLGKPQAQA